MNFNELSVWIEEHTKMLGKLLNYTENIYQKVLSNSEASQIEFEIDNRERLLVAIAKIQQNIESILGVYLQRKIPLAQDQVQFIKKWRGYSEQVTHNIGEVDERILIEVSRVKDATTEEIARIFKSRESFKGYNLKDVKR